MVSAKLYGGLGNQMFQYAAGLALSKKLKSGLYLDLSWFEDIKDSIEVTQRVYELDGFEIYPVKPSLYDKALIKLNKSVVFREKDLNYQPAFEHLKGNVILDGYWQSHRYFENYRSDVVEAFSFPKKISNQNKNLLGQILSTDSVSVHIRRGDYNTKLGRKYHGLVPLGYYQKALSSLAESYKIELVFVFSDDIEWCKKNLKFKFPTVFIDSNGPNAGTEDMRLMSSCKHNILANSSFSWWAAWLNQNPDKVIYAPKVWFKAAQVKINDRIPKEWHKI